MNRYIFIGNIQLMSFLGAAQHPDKRITSVEIMNDLNLYLYIRQ